MLCQAAAMLIALPACFTSQLPAAGPLVVHLGEVSPFTCPTCSGFCTAAVMFLKRAAINYSTIPMGIALLCGSLVHGSIRVVTRRSRLITTDELRILSVAADEWHMGS